MDNDEKLKDGQVELATEEPKFFQIGFWLTLTYIGAILGFSLWDWIDVALMKPNEWGDFLAGVFGPLALLWVVLGFLQQGSELKNSREALLLQAEELRSSVEQQRALVGATREQIKTEQEALFEQRQEKMLALQPAFIMQLSPPSPINLAGIGRSIEVPGMLTNFGGHCTDVKLQAERGVNRVKFRAAILANDDTLNFRLYFDDDTGLMETEVIVTYTLRDGVANERRFDLILVRDMLELRDPTGR